MRRARIAFVLTLVPAVAGASDFWESLLEPGLPRYRSSIETGKVHFARGEWGQALVHFERAVAAMPDRPEGHRLRGDALYRLRRWDGAIESWTRARGIDRLLAYDVELTFEFAIAATYLARTEEAIEEYERLLATTRPGNPHRPIAFANCAELLMAKGPESLDASIALYRASLAEAGGYLPARWGLALALDRAGLEAEAVRVLDDLRRTDRGMSSLMSEDVSYVPEHEFYAYRGLGLEHFGSLQGAASEWQNFLDGGGANGPWAEHGQRHLDAVLLRLARPRQAGRPAAGSRSP